MIDFAHSLRDMRRLTAGLANEAEDVKLTLHRACRNLEPNCLRGFERAKSPKHSFHNDGYRIYGSPSYGYGNYGRSW